MGAAIAKSGASLTLSGSGTLKITGNAGDVLGIKDFNGTMSASGVAGRP